MILSRVADRSGVMVKSAGSRLTKDVKKLI